MKQLLTALLLVCPAAFAQQQNYSQVPDCSLGYCAGSGAPAFSCNAGQKYARVDTPGTNYTCTGFPAHWVQDSGSGGTAISLTTTGTSGASTLGGGILNIPQYQGVLSLTTTGSSGVATLSGTTLNIPNYAGAVSSLTTTGSSGPATLISGVLNIPQYTGGGGGSMVYPGAGIPNSTGSAWATSYAAPSGTIVGTSDTQTLTNKTVDGVSPTTFGFLDATSSIQTQLNARAPLANPTFTGTVTLAADPTTSLGAATKQYVDNAASISGLTTGFIPEANSGTTITNGPIDDGVTTSGHVTVSEPLDVNDGTGIGGGLNSTEGTAITASTNKDTFYAEAASHHWVMNNNNTGPRYVQGIANPGTPGDCWGVASDGYGSVDITCGGAGGNTFSSIILTGSTSGQVTIQAQAVAGTPVIQLPTTTGQMALTSAEVITYSATPTFTPGDSMSRMVLTGNVTSFTLGITASGTPHVLCFQQGSGSYTVTPPANVHGFTAIGTTAGLWNCQAFMYDATDAIWLATASGKTNE